MKNWRNVIFFIGFALFILWYGGTWAYRVMYVEKRNKINAEITTASQQVNTNQTYLTNQENTISSLVSQNYLQRSLPQPVPEGQNLYHTWLLQLTAFCQFEDCAVRKENIGQTDSYYILPYSIRARCSFDQLSRFLYEFYWASFLHKITSLQIQPVEQMDLIDISMQIEGIVLPPLQVNTEPPLIGRLPSGYWTRLSSGTLETYTDPIDARNLLQFSRGGIDESDFARITAINRTDDAPEVWITQLTSNKVFHVKVGDAIRIGSFFATLVDVNEPDVIFETRGLAGRPPIRWLLTTGEYLKDATAIPPEY